MAKGQLKYISDSGIILSCFGMFNEFHIEGEISFLPGIGNVFAFVFNCQLPTAHCQLPTANCLLNTANCLLRAALIFPLATYYFLLFGGFRYEKKIVMAACS